MKADHILILLGLLIIVLVATQALWQRNTVQAMADRDCALFYRSAGNDIEQQCRVKLLQQHSMNDGAYNEGRQF